MGLGEAAGLMGESGVCEEEELGVEVGVEERGETFGGGGDGLLLWSGEGLVEVGDEKGLRFGVADFAEEEEHAIPRAFLDVAVEVGLIGQMTGAATEGLDEGFVIGVEDGKGFWWGGRSMFVEEPRAAGGFHFILILGGWFVGIFYGRRHAFDEIPCSLLGDHPVITFDGRFRQVVVVELGESTRTAKSVPAHGPPTRLDAIRGDFGAVAFQPGGLCVEDCQFAKVAFLADVCPCAGVKVVHGFAGVVERKSGGEERKDSDLNGRVVQYRELRRRGVATVSVLELLAHAAISDCDCYGSGDDETGVHYDRCADSRETSVNYCWV